MKSEIAKGFKSIEVEGYSEQVGTPEFLQEEFGLTAKQITRKILDIQSN